MRLFNIRRSTLIMISAIGFIVVSAVLLIYFEVSWWSIWLFAQYSLLSAAALALGFVFLLGSSRIWKVIRSNDEQSDMKPKETLNEPDDSIYNKLTELDDAANELIALTIELAKVTKVSHFNNPAKNQSYNPKKPYRKSLEERLTEAIVSINYENRNLENIYRRLKAQQQQNTSQENPANQKTGKTKTSTDTSGKSNPFPNYDPQTGRKHSSGNLYDMQNPDYFKGSSDHGHGHTTSDSSFQGQGDARKATVIDDYIQASNTPEKRSYFLEKYSPTTLDTTNVSERLNDSEQKPVFKKSAQGNFMAIKTKTEGLYLIFPNFNFVLKDVNYKAGAVNEVFDCRGYVAGYTYTQIELVTPAVFNNEGDGWAIKTQGVLRLGRGE